MNRFNKDGKTYTKTVKYISKETIEKICEALIEADGSIIDAYHMTEHLNGVTYSKIVDIKNKNSNASISDNYFYLDRNKNIIPVDESSNNTLDLNEKLMMHMKLNDFMDMIKKDGRSYNFIMNVIRKNSAKYSLSDIALIIEGGCEK